MKVTSVEIHPENSDDYAVLSFRDSRRENPYNIKEITGLDADAIIPRYYVASGASNFYNLSLEKRDVVLKIQLNPRYGLYESVSDLRDALYKMIASSRTGKVQLQFKNGTDVSAAISGFVSKFEAALFEKDQEIQLTLSCTDPMLRAITPVMMSLKTPNPAIVDIFDNQSTAPHGFKFEIDITANITDSLLLQAPNDSSWFFRIVLGWSWLAGDKLFFSSEYNDRYLYVVRSTTTYQIADWIGAGSVWPVIFPGNNSFTITHPDSLDWKEISYHYTYWGV